MQLSSACSLSVYRLTVLCTTQHRAEVLAALAQDGKQHSGDSVFFYLMRILGHSEETSTQGLAADLLQALMADFPKHLEYGMHAMPEDWESLASLTQPFTVDAVLQLTVATSSIKVKTAAVLLLLLTAAGSFEGMRKLEASGASSVLWYEMLTICSSWKLGWEQEQLPSGDGVFLFDSTGATDPTKSPDWAQEMAASLPFMTASHALIQSILDQTSITVKVQLLFKRVYLAMATAISTSKWKPAALEPGKAPSNPVSQAARWLRRSAVTTVVDCAFYPFMWQSLLQDTTLYQPNLDMGSLLMMAHQQKELQQKAHSVLDSTQGRCAEQLLQLLLGQILGIDAKSALGVQQQVEKDALVRSMMPSISGMLQHPSQDSRGRAALALAQICTASSNAVAPAVLTSPEDLLGHMLTHLSGDDTSHNRSCYAALIGQCALDCNPAGLKKIGDAGAVPYLLKLLREADNDFSQRRVLGSLTNLAYVSTEMATSIGVHGGAQQLLDILQAGFQQGGNNKLKLSRQATEVTLASLQAMTHLLGAGVGHADMLRADLPALLTNIIQSPTCQGVPDMVDRALTCMYPFTALPAGKTVLLQQMTPASVEPFIHVALTWLEDPESAYTRLVAASDLLKLTAEVPAGRCKLAQLSTCTRLGKILTAGLDNTAQALVLPLCELISQLHQDGSYAPSPWLMHQPVSASLGQAAGDLPAGTPAVQSQQASQQSSSQSHGQTLPEIPKSTSAERLQQNDAQSPAVRPNSQTIQRSTWPVYSALSDADQEAQSARQPAEMLGCTGEAWHNTLVSAAIKLASLSETPTTRLYAMLWLASLVPQLTDQACMDLSNSGAVQASIGLIQQDSEGLQTQMAALAFCLALHSRGLLPVAMLLDANLHQQLAALVIQSDEGGVRGQAGLLLHAMWQVQPPLVSDFVSQKHLSPLLKLAAGDSIHDDERLVCLTLIHQVWMFTASLVSEPLLVQAIPAIVHCCHCTFVLPEKKDADKKQLLLNLQHDALALLCDMADFSFYRPAIRKAEPGKMVAESLFGGWSQSDGQQQQESAQLALNLVYKLLKGQMDGSDGPDAPYNASFYSAVTSNPAAMDSIIHMCRRGRTESRHGALAVLQQIMTCSARNPQSEYPVQMGTPSKHSRQQHDAQELRQC
ncbi:hypothetical protein WJX77_004227 [Trebouxia sp. C0004]